MDCCAPRAQTKLIPLGNERGMSVLELSVAAGISMLVLAGGLMLFNSFEGSSNKMGATNWLTLARNQIAVSVQDKESFEATIRRAENAGSFACQINKTNCRGAGGPIVLQAKSGVRGLLVTKPLIKEVFNPFDATRPNAGLTATGKPCDTFGIAGKKDLCPFRYEASWRAICPGTSGNCFDPAIDIVLNLRFEPEASSKLNMNFNPAAYSFVVHKGQALSDLASLCASVHGTLDSNNNCHTNRNDPCPAGTFIIGFDDNSLPVCNHAWNGIGSNGGPDKLCPLGQVVDSFDPSTGNVHCGPGCASSGSSDLGIIFPNGGTP